MKLNKYLLSVMIGSALVLAACGGEDTDGKVSETTSSESTEETSADESEEKMESGETKETDDGKLTLHKRWEDGETYETGPIILTIDKVFTASGELEGEMANLIGEHVEYIQVDISVENTSENDITFYAGQGIIATNTGEQVETDVWMSDYIPGDMMAGTKASGSFFYILENSNAEEIETIRMVFSAPYETDSFENVGDEIDFEIEL